MADLRSQAPLMQVSTSTLELPRGDSVIGISPLQTDTDSLIAVTTHSKQSANTDVLHLLPLSKFASPKNSSRAVIKVCLFSSQYAKL